MKLIEGIAGFYDASEKKGLPHVQVGKFKKEVAGALAPLGYKLVEVREAGVTPNFHLALFKNLDKTLAVVCNSIYPYVALAEEPENHTCELNYIIDESTEDWIQNYTSFDIIPALELQKELTAEDLSCLNSAELSQAKYWQPKIIGEVIFNWWD